MGLGGYPGDRPAVRRHARHARHLRSQHGDAALRRAARRRRALRRPRDRQSGAFRRRQPTRKIIHIDIDPSSISKRVQGRRADRRRRAGRAAGAASRSSKAGKERPTQRRSRPGGRRSTSGAAKDCLKYDRTVRRSSSRSSWSRSSTR